MWSGVGIFVKDFRFALLNLLKCTYEHKFMFGGNIPSLIVGGRVGGFTIMQFMDDKNIFNLLTLKLGIEWTWGRTESGEWFGGDVAINGGWGYDKNEEFFSKGAHEIPLFLSCNIFKWRTTSGFYLGIRLLTLDIASVLFHRSDWKDYFGDASIFNAGLNIGYDFGALSKDGDNVE